ncbi:hypothetical protein LEQ41_03760 [Streptococcus agalactiae]|nr:hypothetical protein [Streptococcus agalactiae]
MIADDKITWWLRPQTPSEKSWIDFFRNDIRIIEVIWKRYHKTKSRIFLTYFSFPYIIQKELSHIWTSYV